MKTLGGVIQLVVYILWLWVPHVVPCPPQCHSCTGGTANCVQSGLRDIPKNFPDEVEVLDFTGNQISDFNEASFQSLPNVQSLRIPNNGISHIMADSFQNILHLTQIDLSSNSITAIQDGAFQGLDELSIVTLTNNHLQRLGQPFEGLTTLSSVYLGFNQLTEIEEDDFQTNTMIRMLDLSNNQISRIHPKAFQNLERLRYLILSNNALTHTVDLEFSSNMLQLIDFTKSQLKKVPTGMPYSVADLRLGNNMITEIGDDAFKGMRNLRLLMLENNMIKNISYRAFKPLSNLKEVWLSNNQLFYIPQGLPTNLVTLYLDNNQVYEIQSHLFLNHSKLRIISLEMNRIQKVYGESFRGLQGVQQINLQFNEISMIPDGTFTDLSALTTLQLSHNPLTSVDHGAFPPQLNSLTLANIASPTVHVSEQFVSALSSINTLDFMNSPSLVSSTLATLVSSGVRLEQVMILNLQYNEIQSLPETLKESFGSLQQLLLDGNPFHCDRDLIWLKQWMLERQVSFHNTNELECATPVQLRGRKLTDLSDMSFVAVVAKTSEETSPETPAVQVSRVALKGDIVSMEESSPQRGGNPVGETSRNTGTQAAQKLPQPQETAPSRPKTNPKAKTKTKKAKKKGQKRKGKKNRKKNRKNKKGKRKRRNRGKRHNQLQALRRRRCTRQSDGIIECCRVLKNGKQRCRHKRPKQRSKVTPKNITP